MKEESKVQPIEMFTKVGALPTGEKEQKERSYQTLMAAWDDINDDQKRKHYDEHVLPWLKASGRA